MTQCHGTRCRLCRRAASGPSSHPSLTVPRGRAAHKCYFGWCLSSGLLLPCPPSGLAGVHVTPTRIRTSRAELHLGVPSTISETRRWPLRFSALRRLLQHTPAPPSVGCRRSHWWLYPALSFSCVGRPVRCGRRAVVARARVLTRSWPWRRKVTDGHGDVTEVWRRDSSNLSAAARPECQSVQVAGLIGAMSDRPTQPRRVV